MQTTANVNIRLGIEEAWIYKLRMKAPLGLNLIQCWSCSKTYAQKENVLKHSLQVHNTSFMRIMKDTTLFCTEKAFIFSFKHQIDICLNKNLESVDMEEQTTPASKLVEPTTPITTSTKNHKSSLDDILAKKNVRTKETDAQHYFSNLLKDAVKAAKLWSPPTKSLSSRSDRRRAIFHYKYIIRDCENDRHKIQTPHMPYLTL